MNFENVELKSVSSELLHKTILTSDLKWEINMKFDPVIYISKHETYTLCWYSPEISLISRLNKIIKALWNISLFLISGIK